MYETLQSFMTNPETHAMRRDSGEMFVVLFVELTVLFLAISYLVALLKQKLPAEKIQHLHRRCSVAARLPKNSLRSGRKPGWKPSRCSCRCCRTWLLPC